MILKSALYILFLTLIISPPSAKEHSSERTITLTVQSSALDGSHLNGFSTRTRLASVGQVASVVLPFFSDSLRHEEVESDGLFSSKYSLSYMGVVVLLLFLLIRRIFKKFKIPEKSKYSD